MRNFVVIAALLAGTLLGQSKSNPAQPNPTQSGALPCDRTCLESFVNQYLDALLAHNVFGLPLAPKVKFSENDQLLDLGDGMWNVTTGIGPYKIYVADPQSGQVGFLGTVRENDRPVALALRLKIENRKISEIETIVQSGGSGPPPGGRGGAATKAPPPPPTGPAALELMTPDPVFSETVARLQRVSRDALVKAANSYFDALEKGDAAASSFDPQCNRLENGAPASCGDQINSKTLSYIQTVYPRRFPVVDEERQLVFGFFMYQIPGDLLSVESPGHGTHRFSAAQTAPGFADVPALFRIKSGKIRKMESLVVSVPYGTPNPFFNDDWRRAKR
jgi:hypothetical protein